GSSTASCAPRSRPARPCTRVRPSSRSSGSPGSTSCSGSCSCSSSCARSPTGRGRTRRWPPPPRGTGPDVFELWFGIVALMFTLYVVLDGYDLGAGALHLTVAKTDAERRQVLAAIGPYWDASDVWLLAAGGALFELVRPRAPRRRGPAPCA